MPDHWKNDLALFLLLIASVVALFHWLASL